MNKQIRDLAEQAGFYYTDKTGFITPAGCDPAKFAELIVRECADKAHEFIIEDGDEFPLQAVSYRIKQHFGVEE